MNQPTDQDDGSERSNSTEAANVAHVPLSPSFFYQSPQNSTKTYNQNALNSLKSLPSLLSSPLFAPSPSRFGQNESRNTTNDDKNEKGEENGESSQSMQEITVDEKKHRSKPARVSIGTISNERKHLGRGIALFGSESEHEDEPVSKKQKTNSKVQRNQPVDEINSNKNKGGNEIEDDSIAIWEEATSVVPIGNYENPCKGSIHKLEKWTKELLALKKKLEAARVS